MNTIMPDYLFEVSWEVCNKVGGIYTVISSKAYKLQEIFGDRYILIGPDLIRHQDGFIEDTRLFSRWKQQAASGGLRIKTGRWQIDGSPIVILIDFTSFYPNRNNIFGELWNKFRLDSITGQWDYIDPALFGYAAGCVIESYYNLHLNATDNIVAQFHEWMTGTGVLYLENKVPQIATVFTAHATVLGRALSGNSTPLADIQTPAAAATRAEQYHLTAKHSLEKTTALNADCFCCVSEVTAKECMSFLGKAPDVITPNGFHPGITTSELLRAARMKLLQVASALLKEPLAPDTPLFISSGRYEFHNKGIDTLLDAFCSLEPRYPAILFLFIPAAHTGPRDLSANDPNPLSKILTHNLYTPEQDPICQKLLQQGYSHPARVIFAPVYLDGNDGIFNMTYYDLLPAFDLAIFPSCYEPWGYTPMESLAAGVPAITTALTGFGQAAGQLPAEERNSLTILSKNDPTELSAALRLFATNNKEDRQILKENASTLSQHFTWENYIVHYFTAWHTALQKTTSREHLYHNKPLTLPADTSTASPATPEWREINIGAASPEKILELYHPLNTPLRGIPVTAYFCMEYAIHPALRTYAGGLGVLAGDYLKTASDMNVPIIAVGLFYRHGFFVQQLTGSGQQLALKDRLDPTKLPLEEVKDDGGHILHIMLNFPARPVYVKAWKTRVGNTTLYLLDTDLIINKPDDRLITAQLYPAEKEYRLQQEIVLGIGGVRLLKTLNLTIDVYHCNEGHAAFMTFERLRYLILDKQLPFEQALEIVKASQLFTTHTSVPAAMDTYDEALLHAYLSHMAGECFISWQQLWATGKLGDTFSMFCLAARTSQITNAVSTIHKEVTAELLHPLWQDFQADELPLIAITNGIHLPTWLAPEWHPLYEQSGINLRTGEGQWENFQHLSDQQIWSVRKTIKEKYTARLRNLLNTQFNNHHYSQARKDSIMPLLQPGTLFIGLARRITHYKQQDILYYDPVRLYQLLNNTGHPVVILVAGKAHPADTGALEMLEKINSMTSDPHIIFIEDYDLETAQLLTRGTDCWLNLPIRRQEACGTSGMKALINGVLNLSTPDGWWAEYHTPGIGWSLAPGTPGISLDDPRQHNLDAEEVYNLLQHQIIPLYFARDENNMPTAWIAMIRNALAQTAGHLSMNRMINEYQCCYKKLYDHTLAMSMNNYQQTNALVAWKDKIRTGWHSIRILEVNPGKHQFLSSKAGETITADITLETGTLEPGDINIAVIIVLKHGVKNETSIRDLLLTKHINHRATYAGEITVTDSGEYTLAFRILAKNYSLLSKTDMPYVLWA